MRKTYLASLALCILAQFAVNGVSADAFRPKVAVPQDIQKIPDGYFEPSLQPGTLQELTYQTYESFSYRQKSRKLQKRAIVYLPYGYQKDQPYDVFYLMHGGGRRNRDPGNSPKASPVQERHRPRRGRRGHPAPHHRLSHLQQHQ